MQARSGLTAAIAVLLASCVSGAVEAPETSRAKPDHAAPAPDAKSADLDAASMARPGDDHPGRKVYDAACAMCHERPTETRAPALDALRSMSADNIRRALTEGVMQAQGAALTRAQLSDVVAYLGVPEGRNDAWLEASMCPARLRTVDVEARPTVADFGFGLKSHRRMTAQEAGLTSGDLKKLKLEWALAFPQTTTMRAQPVIVGSTMFISVGDTNRVYALDTQSGCIKWSYLSDTQLRTALTFGEVGPDRRKVLLVGDVTRWLLQIDAETGQLIWRKDIRLFDRSRPSAASLIYKDKIIVPLSNREASQAPDDRFECCRTHGGVLALDAVTGERIWTYHTMEGATLRGENSVGTPQWGPSGAPIWANLTIDEKRNVVYATTGENFSLPATDTSDAIIAIDLDTGRQKWSFQGTPNDAWNSACGTDRSGANCPPADKSIREDFDFGGAAVLATGKTGREMLLAGQKSGHVWALNPDNGKLVWSERFGRGTTLGGNHMGVAVDDERVFVPINDSKRPNRIGSDQPGMNALDIETGKVLWRYHAKSDCGEGRRNRAPRCDIWYGLSSPPLVIDQSVVASSVDGKIFIFDASTGAITWQYDTLRDFQTVNGVPGKGGQIDNGAFVAADGALFVQSGYGAEPGNVLLKFVPAPE